MNIANFGPPTISDSTRNAYDVREGSAGQAGQPGRLLGQLPPAELVRHGHGHHVRVQLQSQVLLHKFFIE